MAPQYHRPTLTQRRRGTGARVLPGGVLTPPGSGRGQPGRSALEILAAVAERFGQADADDAGAGGRRGQLRQWCDGVAQVRSHRAAFADYWRRQNLRALAGPGPLWAALGDSAAQGLGAAHPRGGYVGQAHAELVARTGRPWRLLNLSSSGATIADLIREQLPRLARLPVAPDLVTCGIGTNDLIRLPPRRVRALFRELVAALPDNAVILDIPLPVGRWWVGRLAVPYVARVNAEIYAAAQARRLPVAYISAHFRPPWSGRFGPDDFHPNDAGYRDWSRAVLRAIHSVPLPTVRLIGNDGADNPSLGESAA